MKPFHWRNCNLFVFTRRTDEEKSLVCLTDLVQENNLVHDNSMGENTMGKGYFSNIDISEIRILPNGKQIFETEAQFKNFFQNTMPEQCGFYYFPNQMMRCPDHTFVLFQYDGMIRATGVLISSGKKNFDEKGESFSGYYRFKVDSLHYLAKPIDKKMLKQVYPEFNGFNQSKQIIPLTYWPAICTLLEKSDPYYSDDSLRQIEGIENVMKSLGLKGGEREAFVNARVNQGIFRDKLMKRYSRCCLCGMSNDSLLTASHIKPWSASNSREKLDVENGFLMCPNHDKLFDQGWITFDENGNIVVADELSQEDRNYLNIKEDMKIQLTDKNKAYLLYHRNNIFRTH